jgi:hypothetical protein
MCRTKISSETNYLTSSLLIRQQVDELLVKCKLCNESKIERGNFENHCQNCSKRTVRCSNAGIGCPWSGQIDKRDKHTKHCQFQLFRSVLLPFEIKMKGLKATVQEQHNMIQQLQNHNQQLKTQIEQHERQIIRLKKRINLHDIFYSSEEEDDHSYHTNMLETHVRQRQPMIADLTTQNPHNSVRYTCTRPKETMEQIFSKTSRYILTNLKFYVL